jgi:hypothetical protein
MTIDVDQRYAELLTHVDFDDWHMFVVGSCYVIERHTGEDQQILALGLIEAKRREVDWSHLHWRFYLWQLGCYADFIERLERATTQRPDAGTDCGDDCDDSQPVDAI